MTYVIEGKLVVEDKPEKYMNKFVDFKVTQYIKFGSVRTRRKLLHTTSERFAKRLNKRGHDLQWNDDLDRAIEMCERKEIDVSKTKLFAPQNWCNYLTKKFGESKDTRTLDGKLEVWNDLRLPTPWLYVLAPGKLKDIFIFDEDGFVKDSYRYTGKRFAGGVVIDLPFLYLGVVSTKSKTNKFRF